MAFRVSQPGRTTLVVALVATLAVFGVVTGFVSLRLRSGLREQILEREAEALTAVATLELDNEADSLAALGVKDAPGELLNAVLKTSKLRGVFAVRVFDANQQFNGALPLPWSEEPPPSSDWAQLRRGQPIARLHPRESAASVIGLVPSVGSGTEPLLETWLPLRRVGGQTFEGAAQMWTDGRAIAREFARVDRRLWGQAIAAWLAGSALIAGVLVWAYRRLEHANAALQARTDDLVRANRELALAAKTSALGAVAAHLVHELKNPLAGLEEFVATQSERRGDGNGDDELLAASELTQRLRGMVNDVVGVMRDEQASEQFELTGSEIAELASQTAAALASDRHITLHVTGGAENAVPGRRANLARLVLRNLLQNAIEATPADGRVILHVTDEATGIAFVVADTGPGLPARVREHLFQPCTSSKRGGSGIGLALSQHLARQAGGRIDLVSTGPAGTSFRLELQGLTET